MNGTSQAALATARIALASLVPLAADAPPMTAQMQGVPLDPGGAAGREPHPAPPEIKTTLRPDAVARVGQELRFLVKVEDPDGGRVDVRLLEVPPGLIFHPVVEAAGVSIHEVRWQVVGEANREGGRRPSIRRSA